MICGLHAAKAALQAAPEKVIRLLIDRKRRDQRIRAILDAAKQNNIRIEYDSRDALDEKAKGQVHQGVLLFSKGITPYREGDIDRLLENCNEEALVLVLDGVTDPHNLGACMRTAEAAGVDFVVASKDRAAGINATVRKTASGAAERLPFVQVTNLARSLRQLQDAGLWVTGTAVEGENLQQVDMTGPRAIVMGSEGKGMRRLTREHCDQLVKIPMQGQIESLNVSVAAGIVLYEVVRQRSLQ